VEARPETISIKLDVSMSRWLQRIVLAQNGWKTEARFSKTGTSSKDPNVGVFGVWAKRNFWGHSLSDVCLYSTVRINLADAGCEHDVNTAFDTVHEACHRAMREYTDTVPCQYGTLSDGRIGFAEHKAETEYMRKFVGEVRPTEKIAKNFLNYSGSNDHVEALLEAARQGIYIDDHLTYYFGPRRMPRDVAEREWGYKLRLFPTMRYQEQIAFAPIEFTSRMINEDAVSSLIEASSNSVVDLFDRFAPGGKLAGQTRNGLPPGYNWYADILEDRRIASEAEDIDQPLKM
jgi:hypothetical protein